MARLTRLREVAFWWLSVAAIKAGGPALIVPAHREQQAERVRVARVERRATDALAYVDKSIDNVEDLGPDVIWMDDEVVEMLDDIRSLLVTGEIKRADHANGGL